MDDLDLLQFEEFSELESGAKRGEVVSALQG
jgi:hypothetical protein